MLRSWNSNRTLRFPYVVTSECSLVAPSQSDVRFCLFNSAFPLNTRTVQYFMLVAYRKAASCLHGLCSGLASGCAGQRPTPASSTRSLVWEHAWCWEPRSSPRMPRGQPGPHEGGSRQCRGPQQQLSWELHPVGLCLPPRARAPPTPSAGCFVHS